MPTVNLVVGMRQNRVVAHARIRTIIINSEQPDLLVGFWSRLLGVAVLEHDDEAGIVWLAPDTEGGVNLGFQWRVMADPDGKEFCIFRD